MVLRTDDPGQIALDSGPLIGLLNRNDPYRDEALRGFERLDKRGTQLLVPLAIVFEVFKWLLYHTDVATARSGLTLMLDRVEVVYHASDSVSDMIALIEARPRWPGSLEDVALSQVALQHGIPVWTFNYRDLRAFSNLQVWAPG